MAVREVRSRKEMDAFIRFPLRLFRDEPNFVPHLLIERKDFFNPSKNPFFQHADVTYFLAWDQGRVTGRVAAIINHAHNEFHQDRVGFFGFFDAIDDAATAHALLDAAADVLRKAGCDTMRGPANFSTNDECGMLVDGFDSPPVIMMTWNPPYYLNLVESYGMKKAMDLYAYYVRKDEVPLEKLTKACQLIERKTGAVIRKARLKELQREVAVAFEIYNRAWARNWGFIPMTKEEFTHLANDLELILDEDFLYFAEVDGKAVGFILALPDLNQVLIKTRGRLFPTGIIHLLFGRRKIDTLRVITMGIVPEYQKRGLDVLLYTATIRAAMNKRYVAGELSWVLENNAVMNHIAEKLGSRRYKTYRFYEKSL